MKNMSKLIIKKINEIATPVKIMHVCGSHEHTIMENGIRTLLPEEVEIVAGPGLEKQQIQVGSVPSAAFSDRIRQDSENVFRQSHEIQSSGQPQMER